MSLLQVRGLSQVHRRRGLRRGEPVPAVREVDLDLAVGESLGLVGESGCGKSSLARALLRLDGPPTAGTVFFDGVDLAGLSRAQLRRLRTRLQYVPQDSAGSLDPLWTVAGCLTEPLRVHRRPHPRALVEQALRQVGLPATLADRYPHELSGGQRQRVAIARALILEPDLVVLDEPLTALDVSVQAGVIALLNELRRELGVAVLLIGHDLGAVRQVCDRLAVMYLGRIVETGPTAALLDEPRHPYTRALLAAVPDPWRPAPEGLLAGEPPSVLRAPPGCAFHPRCPLATDRCRVERPALLTRDGGHQVACHHA